MASHYARKEDRRETRETQESLGRARVKEEEKCTWKRAWRTRADASIRGTERHAEHTCIYTTHTYTHEARGEHTRGEQNGERV